MKDRNALSVLTSGEKATLSGPLEGATAALWEEVTRAALLWLPALTTECSPGFLADSMLGKRIGWCPNLAS